MKNKTLYISTKYLSTFLSCPQGSWERVLSPCSFDHSPTRTHRLRRQIVCPHRQIGKNPTYRRGCWSLWRGWASGLRLRPTSHGWDLEETPIDTSTCRVTLATSAGILDGTNGRKWTSTSRKSGDTESRTVIEVLRQDSDGIQSKRHLKWKEKKRK